MAEGEPRLLRDSEKIQQAAWWAGDVALRFEVYDYAEPEFDIYQAIYERLVLWGREFIVDIGCRDGNFLFYLKKMGHQGDLIGIEPELSTVMPVHTRSQAPRFFETVGRSLPGGDNTVDILTCNFMLYFGDDQADNLNEFERVLKPEGKLVVSTSGDSNKARQRIFEQLIARSRGAKAPDRMNAKFDSDIAAEVLSQRYANIYHGSYRGHMVFRKKSEIAAYYKSLLSMKDFFDPPLSEAELEESYLAIVAPVIEREIEQLGHFTDYVQRDFFICNNDAYSLWMYDLKTAKHVNIKGYYKDNLGVDEEALIHAD